jgi:hypothetical protein
MFRYAAMAVEMMANDDHSKPLAYPFLGNR